MFDIDEAKLPPPKPASAAMKSMTPNGVSGLPTAMPSAVAGISRSAAEIIVQLRPPNFGTRKVYGKRRVAPTSAGIEMSQNVWPMSKLKPAAGSCTTTMLQKLPDDKAEELGEDRPAQVAVGDRATPTFPLHVVLGVPVVN